MNILQTIEESISNKQEELQHLLKVKLLVQSLSQDKLADLPDVSVYNGTLDFDNLSHANVMKVIKAFKAGKWTKTPSEYDPRIHYETTLNGVKIRCWSGEPPPNCKVVEHTITVPAEPERTRTVRRLVCVDPVV